VFAPLTPSTPQPIWFVESPERRPPQGSVPRQAAGQEPRRGHRL